MRRTANRLLASCVATALCISLAGNAQAPAPVPAIPYVAEAKAVIEIAKDIYDFFSNSSNGDTVQLQKDVTWMKEKSIQMDHKLDNISAAISALPGFIKESFDDEARKNALATVKVIAVDYPEWSSNPTRYQSAIDHAYYDLHKAAGNMISRKPYADYNLIALSMTIESKLRRLNKRNTPVDKVFIEYADYFAKATSSSESGSLAAYRDGLKSNIAALEARHASINGTALCVFGKLDTYQSCDAKNKRCTWDNAKVVKGSLVTGYYEDGTDAIYLYNCHADTSCQGESDWRGPYPLHNVLRGCAVLGGGREGDNLNEERSRYLSMKDALQAAEVALRSAEAFRCQAELLSGRRKLACPLAIDFKSTTDAKGVRIEPALLSK